MKPCRNKAYCFISCAHILAFLLFTSHFATCQATQPSGSPSKSTKSGTANQAGYSPNDAVTPAIIPAKFAIPTISPDKCGGLSTPLDLFQNFVTNQRNADCLLNLFAVPVQSGILQKGNGIILHIVVWTSSPKYQPRGGAWGFYRVSKGSGGLRQSVDISGTPYFYNAPHVYFVDLNYFDDGLDQTKVALAYDVKTTARQKQNTSDAQTLISA